MHYLYIKQTMELTYDPTVEKDTINFGVYNTTTIKTNEPCVVCNGINGTWDSYVLSCSHKAHTRCFRRYLFTRNAYACPVCDVLIGDYLCSICKKLNHTERTCERNPDCDIGPLIMKYSYKFIVLKYTKLLNFDTKLDMIWALFFQLLKLDWKYTRSNIFPFDVTINNINVRVKTVNTNNYNELIKEYDNIESKKFKYTSPFLLVGNRLFDYDDIDNLTSRKELAFVQHTIRIIGLICYKHDSNKYHSMCYLLKNNNKYTVARDHYEYNCLMEISENTSNGKDYVCKSGIKCDINKINCKELIDILWDNANKLDK